MSDFGDDEVSMIIAKLILQISLSVASHTSCLKRIWQY